MPPQQKRNVYLIVHFVAKEINIYHTKRTKLLVTTNVEQEHHITQVRDFHHVDF